MKIKDDEITTVTIKGDVWKKLSLLKIELELDTINDVIARLLKK